MSHRLRRFIFAMALLLLFVVCGAAQVQVLPQMPVTLSGSLSAGYAGGTGAALGSQTSSSDSLTLGVMADLNGSYYDPRFLQFSVSPRFTWDRNGSQSESALEDRDDGMNASVDFLQGSKTPIHFSYNLTQTNTATLSGGPNAFTVGADGLAQSYSISASPRLGFLPPISFSFSHSNADTSVTGVQEPSLTTSNNFLNVLTNYNWLGFHMSGNYAQTSNQSTTQDLLNLGVPAAPSNSSSRQENFGLSHDLPLHGSASLAYGHSTDSYTLSGTPENDSYDTAAGSVALVPIPKLTWNASVDYTSNATNQLISEVLNGQSTTSTVLGTGRTTLLQSTASYQIGHGWTAGGSGSHETSTVAGEGLIQDLGYGTVTYGRVLWHGFLNVSYSPGWNSVEIDSAGTSETTSGLYNAATASYQHRVRRWTVNGSTTFMRNNAYITSAAPVVANAYSATGSARARLRYTWNLNLNASFNKSQVAGSNSNLSDVISGQLSNRTWSFTGQYQRNSGYYLFASSGIPVVVSTNIMGIQTLYNTSQSYSGSLGYNRGLLSAQASYSHTNGVFDTVTVPTTTVNSFFEGRLYYKFRKLDFQAGYRRLTQSASSNNALNQISNGYWLSVVRRFRAF
ncbi:MAG: hypothetical protein ACLP3R_17835 [Candidatus Korobacteraceae bacterium]